ncbi:Hypothetical predicted protein [Marmota monax]|uniref:Uncharacterized protein n=1 Tax=Marmota monax TaxID=9995 RepID=A0A5E4BKM8_MARMO|nr:hypothetical protein GHT09_014541 [Marmota monax]VTJ69489.1 Hypothetical predicted protein [Marmota monax]
MAPVHPLHPLPAPNTSVWVMGTPRTHGWLPGKPANQPGANITTSLCSSQKLEQERENMEGDSEGSFLVPGPRRYVHVPILSMGWEACPDGSALRCPTGQTLIALIPDS